MNKRGGGYISTPVTIVSDCDKVDMGDNTKRSGIKKRGGYLFIFQNINMETGKTIRNL
ncbi:hypothetical protein BgiMline_026903, partial [Biomphalaria glabrata]